jgi:acyl-CoA synthetase (AMP-forming)/AMP-acid ligase II
MLNRRNQLRRSVTLNRHRLAIVHGERRLTYGEAPERGLRLANALLDMGLEPVCTVSLAAIGGTREQEIGEMCRARLGFYKKPGRVELQPDPLPRTPVGKVSRKPLREPHWAGHDRRTGGS